MTALEEESDASTAANGDNPNKRPEYNKFLLYGLPLAGASVVWFSFWIGPILRKLGLDQINGDSKSLAESISINLGTALFALVFFYVAEKNLIHAVVSEQQSKLLLVKQDIDAARAELTSFKLSRREQRQNIMANFDGIPLDLDNYWTFLSQAEEDGAFWNGSISVPASISPGAFVLNFAPSKTGTVILTLSWGTNDLRCSEEWVPEQRFTDVMKRLHIAAEKWSQTEDFDWEMAIKRLPDAVRLADQSVLSNAEGMLKGRPREFVGSDWALTTNGIERLSGRSGSMTFDSITTKRSGLRKRIDESSRPEGVDEQAWHYLLHLFDKALEHRELMTD